MLYDFILNILQWLYNNLAFQNLFFAIILLTIAVRIVLLPLFYKSSKDQLLMKKAGPKIERIKKIHKDDKERQAQEMMKVYKEYKLNPFSSILLIVIQLPIFIALFRIFRDGELLTDLFADGSIFGGMELASPSVFAAGIAAALQYVNGRMSLVSSPRDGSGKSPMANFGKTFVYIMPFITLFILMKLPAALGVYWAASTVFSIGQTLVIKRKLAYSDVHNDGGDTEKTGETSSIDGV